MIAEPAPVRTLVWDIETSALLAYAHEPWGVNINRKAVRELPQMACFGAKWLGANSTEFWSVPGDGHERMVHRCWELLDEADQVVSFNGARFDTRRANNEFARLHMGPPSSYQEVDLFRAAKKRFDFLYKSLDHLAMELGLGRKQETDDWYKLMELFLIGDPKAMSEMRSYNLTDVDVTEQVYNELRDWL